MAVTWNVAIEVLDLGEKRLRVTGTRTDDDPGASTPEWSHSVQGQVDTDDLASSRQKIVDRIWGTWQEYLTRQSQAATLLAGWESALENDLDTLEVG